MQNSKLVKRGLLFASAIMGASMLATYFLGFVIGFMLNVFMFIGVILYIQRKGFNVERGGHYGSSSTGSAEFNTKPIYVCLACGSKVMKEPAEMWFAYEKSCI